MHKPEKSTDKLQESMHKGSGTLFVKDSLMKLSAKMNY
jgi:hypothetical protein